MEPIIPFKMAANVQSMYQYWKNFDLQDLQRELDNAATELANRQDESDGSRTRLVAQSRDFKKNTPEDIRSIVAPLLRSFQLEVDSLCTRSKAAEAAFLSLYTKLIHLPDPAPTLQLAQDLEEHAHRLLDMEVENQQLRGALAKYGHDLVEVHRQVVTFTQVKEQVKEHEDREDSAAQTRTQKKERELHTSFADKERQLQEGQLSFRQKLGEAETQITTLHAGLETSRSELFEVKSKYDQVTSFKSTDMDMVKAELDHANERAANAERQAERLKHQLTLVTEGINLRSEQQNSASDHTMDILKRSSLEIELAAKDKEVARLIEDVQRLNKLRETALTQVTRLEAELCAKNQAFRVLEEKLRTQDNYEDVKRELRVLKSTDFANAYNEESSGHDRKSLEVLLLEKTKLLHTDSAHLKLVNSCLTYNHNNGSSATCQTTTNSAKKAERSLTPTPSPSSPVPLFSPTSAAISLALVSAATTTPTFSRCSSVSSAKTYTTEVTITSTSTVPKVMSSSPTLAAATSIIKQEASSPVSTTRATPHSVAYTNDSYSSMAISDLTVNFLRMPSTPSSGRYSPTANCKLSPDIPTPSQTPHANSGPPQSPITALHPHLDQRHFPPPFYGFPTNPFHPAFLPLNMVKSEVTSSGGLDTGYVAKTVRELLSIHNIGQRLFAKHVLGLSQGTVSELLSKPKSWDKLTEKGRESYRKMHAWAIDDANIMALKAISPKKGTQPITSNNSYKEKEDSATEERIANILSEAQVAMHMKKSLEQQQVAGAIVSSLYHHELSKLGGAPPGLAMMSPTMPPVSLSNGPHYSREGPRKVKDGDSRYHSSSSSQEDMASAQEIVTRIYRQELIKLKKAADAAGNIAASAMYAQELSRLDISQNTGMPITSSSQLRHSSSSSPPPADSPEPSPLALDYRSTRPNGLKLKTEPPDSTSDETASHINSCGAIDLSKPSSHAGSTPSSSPTSESGRHAGSAFFLVRPRMNGHDSGVSESPLTPTQQQTGSTGGPRYGSVPPAECLSPLQRMQNIANSLTTRPSVGMPSNKPLRAVLPPITQEEFDRYANVNTDDLVKKIKETLSQYSISQRLFGESILGLSQGSVSDLLARPKPWHMLTQKGREPFIRMQIFLEDAESIPKLVASQYRIPPDKLMRSNSRGSSEPESPCDLPAHSRSLGSSMPSQQHQAPLPPPPPPPLLISHPPPLSLTSTLPTSCSTSSPSSPSPSLLSPSALSASRHSRPSLPPPPPPPPPHPLSLPHSPILPSPTTPTSLGNRLGPPTHIPPSLPHGIGPSGLPLHEHFLSTSVGAADPATLQRVWGTFAYPSSMLEVIAMTSEIDTLSLTSRVKDVLQFHNLGQKLFGEAVLGLSQGSVSELLSKPKPWHMLSIKGREPFIKMHLWLGDPQNVEHLKLYQTQMKAHRRRKSSMDDRSFDSPTQPKRPRVFFTEDQKDSLRQAYSQDPYPNQSTIETLARSLNVGVKTVINWFHNHRMRAKQQHHAGGDTSIKSEPDESSNQSDISCMSGDVTSAMTGGQFFHGGITPTDVNQWIFPQFEPVGLMRKVPCLSEDNSEDNKENNGGLEEEEDEDEDDEPDGMDSSVLKSNTVKKDNDDAEENGSKSEDEEGGKHEADDVNDGNQTLTKSGEDICGGMSSTAANSNSVNKRKRSNPQRVYEGAQLDRTLSGDKGTAGSHHPIDEKVELLMDSQSGQSSYSSESIHASTNIKYISTEEMNGHASNSDNVSSPSDSKKYSFKNDTCSNTSKSKQEYDNLKYDSQKYDNQKYDNQKYDNKVEHRIQKIEKIQKAIRSTVEHWDDDDDDDDDNDDEKVACSSIEKIQKHLETKSTDEDWEF